MVQAVCGLGALTVLAWICPRVRVGSRFHRGLGRGLEALGVLLVLSLAPGFRVGVNALTVVCVALLGLPGAGMLQVIAMMP